MTNPVATDSIKLKSSEIGKVFNDSCILLKNSVSTKIWNNNEGADYDNKIFYYVAVHYAVQLLCKAADTVNCSVELPFNEPNGYSLA